MSYGIAKRLSPRRANFGKGEPEGIIAPETADHAAGTSALLPMLSLGIPGSATAAVMMGGLMIWGLNPGPMLFVEQKDFVWGLIASMYLGNVVAVVLVLLTVPIFAALMRVPFFIIAPVIVIICTVGAYSVSNSYLDVVLMMGFGVLGYLFKKLHYPLAPLVLAIVIGDKAEDAFRQSMLMSRGSLGIFFGNTLVTTLVLLGAALLVHAGDLADDWQNADAIDATEVTRIGRRPPGQTARRPADPAAGQTPAGHRSQDREGPGASKFRPICSPAPTRRSNNAAKRVNG